MRATENTYNLKPGTSITFTPTGREFKLAKVTDKMVSWYTSIHKGGSGKNILKMASTSLRIFNEGIAEGTYIINS